MVPGLTRPGSVRQAVIDVTRDIWSRVPSFCINAFCEKSQTNGFNEPFRRLKSNDAVLSNTLIQCPAKTEVTFACSFSPWKQVMPEKLCIKNLRAKFENFFPIFELYGIF